MIAPGPIVMQATSGGGILANRLWTRLDSLKRMVQNLLRIRRLSVSEEFLPSSARLLGRSYLQCLESDCHPHKRRRPAQLEVTRTKDGDPGSHVSCARRTGKPWRSSY